MVGIDRAVLGQRLHGCEAAPAGDHGIGTGSGGIVAFGAGDEVFQKAVGGDGGLDLGLGDRIGRGLADVLGREREPGERDLPDQRFGPGGAMVHAYLSRFGDWDRWNGARG